MKKSRTAMKAGMAVAVYTEDGQGRRLSVHTESEGFSGANTVILATTQKQAKEVIKVLYQLLEELPVDDGPDPRTKKDPITL